MCIRDRENFEKSTLFTGEVPEERQGHVQGQSDIVVPENNRGLRTPDCVRSACSEAEQSTLETVESQGQCDNQEKIPQLLLFTREHCREECHDYKLRYILPLLPGDAWVDGKQAAQGKGAPQKHHEKAFSEAQGSGVYGAAKRRS